MVSEGRGNPKLVVNIVVSEDGDPRKRSQNVLHFGRSVVVVQAKIFHIGSLGDSCSDGNQIKLGRKKIVCIGGI